jgi:site-specific DNA-methyltransferase (adenine-specific)
MNRIVYGDNLPILKGISRSSVDLIYIDPPFNTGKTQVRHRITTVRDDDGDRTGFGGKRYKTIKVD